MEPISRRAALKLGGVGAAFVVAGGAGLLWGQLGQVSASTSFVPRRALTQPKMLRSANGILDVTLPVAEVPVLIGDTRVTAMTYGGSLPGPTLVVRPGDVLSIALENRLAGPTNLHTHGLHVSPDGSSDNVLRRVDAGTTADYRYEIPAGHPPGVFWYHPHHHGMAADQVFGGLYGTIIVEDPVPLEVTRERVLVISDMTFDSSGQIAAASQMDRMSGREGLTMLVNGQLGATLAAHPGDRERWRIVNACSSRYLDLRLDGQQLELLGNDSGRFAMPQRMSGLSLLPGNRADVLVTMVAGRSTLRAVPVDRGSAAGMGGTSQRSSSTVELAALTVSGSDALATTAAPPRSTPRDLRIARTTGSRTLTLAMGGGMGGGMSGGGGMMGFTIDGKTFDPTRIDQRVNAGAIEEWTIINTSPMDHPFHLHVWPMQVITVGSDTLAPATWQDVVNVPAHSRSTVRIAFEDFTGTAVFHCHILDHEDNGMMGIITVA
jgi:FtsP/CotA-like multicopper oxidase with cupredoxin domain